MIMSSAGDASDVPKTPRDQKGRQSLQVDVRKHVRSANRMTQSARYNNSPKIMVTTPTIVEEEEDNTMAFTVENEMKRTTSKESVKSEKSKKDSLSIVKKISVNRHVGNAFDNPTYEGPSSANGSTGNRKTSKISLGVADFQRGGSSSSVRSSRHDPSVASMEVQREQYCCFSRWSTCEKRLALVVAILATIILILVIAVGYLAGKKGEDIRFNWNF